MCGIFAYCGNQNTAAKIVLSGLKSLEYRGYDSWGVATTVESSKSQVKSTIVVKKNIGKIGDANVDELPTSTMALGHTRWATHGGVTVENAHPHLDCTQTLALVHNGIIENFAPVKEKLISQGHRFHSQTDSEVAVHLVEEKMKGMPLEDALTQSFQMIEGSNALIVFSPKEQSVIALRNGSPLVFGFGDGEQFVASDPAALLPHTKRVYFLQNGEYAVITNDGMIVKSIADGKIIPVTIQTLTWDTKQSEKNGFDHFMLKEIHEQPEILTHIINSRHPELTRTERSRSVSGSSLLQSFNSTKNMYLTGCGTAYHAALLGKTLLNHIAHKNATAVMASELSNEIAAMPNKSLLITLSQSGETMDLLEAVKLARTKNVTVFVLVNVEGSSLYREADASILLGAGPEKAVASTKAFTAKLAWLIIIASTLVKKTDKAHRLLDQSVNVIKHLLNKESVFQQLAHKLKTHNHLYVLGRGLHYSIALETALKIKEISYIHAEGFAAGELKHGVLALIEKGTPCILFVPNDEHFADNISSAMELKARGAHIIGVSSQKHDVFDDFIEVADCQEATIIPNAVVGQLLAYHLAVAKNLDPDMPRNLAKSVTVK